MGELATGSHLDEAAELRHDLVVGSPLGSEDVLSCLGLLVVLFSKRGKRPRGKLLGNLNSSKLFPDLPLELLDADRLLGARTFSFRAMVVDVVVLVPVLLFFRLLLGRDHSTALSTADESSERELVLFLAWNRPPIQDVLGTIKLGPGDHGSVLALVPLTVIPKPPVVERVSKHFIEFAKGWLLPARESYLPVVDGDPVDPLHSVVSVQEEPPAPLDPIVGLGVRENPLLSFDASFFIDVADGRLGRQPAHFGFLHEPSLHVSAEIPDELVREPELHAHHHHIVGRKVGALVGPDPLDSSLLELPSKSPGIDRIPGQTIELPTKNALNLSISNSIHHLVEVHSPGFLGGLHLREDTDNLETLLPGEIPKRLLL